MPVLGFVHNVLLHCCSTFSDETLLTDWDYSLLDYLLNLFDAYHTVAAWRQSLQCLKIFRSPCTVAILKRNHVLIGVWTILVP